MAENVVKKIFNIPNWYKFSDFGLRNLYSYVREASSIEEALWFRFLDYASFCDNDKCFFCGEGARQQPRSEPSYTLPGHLGTVNMASENSAEIEGQAVVSD